MAKMRLTKASVSMERKKIIFLLIGLGLVLPIIEGGERPNGQTTQVTGPFSKRHQVGPLSPNVKDDSLIVPGQRLGSLKLGDTRKRALELFPRKGSLDQEYEYDVKTVRACGTQYRWVNMELESMTLKRH